MFIDYTISFCFELMVLKKPNFYIWSQSWSFVTHESATLQTVRFIAGVPNYKTEVKWKRFTTRMDMRANSIIKHSSYLSVLELSIRRESSVL